jgi:hypothetical protein
LDRSLGTLLDGVALRGSLRSCPEALRLDDVLETNGLVLFSLDVADYPHATRKVASWVLLGMGRLARQLSTMAAPERVTGRSGELGERGVPRALLLVDEVGALGHSARHLRGLVGRARESWPPRGRVTSRPSIAHYCPGPAGHGVAAGVPSGLTPGRGALEALFGRARVKD